MIEKGVPSAANPEVGLTQLSATMNYASLHPLFKCASLHTAVAWSRSSCDSPPYF
jgi:hypothetical protein